VKNRDYWRYPLEVEAAVLGRARPEVGIVSGPGTFAGPGAITCSRSGEDSRPGSIRTAALDRTHARYVYEFVRSHPRFVRFFRYVTVPDEIFFQTIIGNSPYAREVHNDTLTFVEWYRRAVLHRGDLEALRSTYHLFARKFDPFVDAEILDLVDRELLGVTAA
jgi:hypothetical protein